MTGNEIINWAGAFDVKDALELQDIPEAGTLQAAAIRERTELVRTAAGIVLLDHYEAATHQAEQAKKALGILGFAAELPDQIEAEPDILLGLKNKIGLLLAHKP